MAKAEIRTNMDTVVVNVTEQPPKYDASDLSPAKFKYTGENPEGNVTDTLGYHFAEGEAVEVTDPMHKFKLRGNPHFEEVGAKKGANPSAGSAVDPTEQGEEKAGPSRGADYETARPPYASVLDSPNPLSEEQQKLEDEKDIEAGRKTIAEASDPKARKPKQAKEE